MKEYAPQIHMHRICIHEIHVAIDTRTCIPARIVFACMVNSNFKHIIFAITNIRSQIIKCRHIPIWTITNKFSIKIYSASVIYTFKINVDFFSLFLSRNDKFLCIPSHTSRKVARCAVFIWTVAPLNAPIMRKHNCLPF